MFFDLSFLFLILYLLISVRSSIKSGVYSVKIKWVYYTASISIPCNLLFLVHHYHEQNIYAYHQVPKLLITYTLYFSSLIL
jgi:hypothetical protein